MTIIRLPSGKYNVGPIQMCASCGKEHRWAEVVVDDHRVWFRCPQTTHLVYIRDERKK